MCHLKETQCSEHNIKHGDLFNEKMCTDKKFFQKNYILKCSGIPITCPRCKEDLLFHHSYHIKCHKKCRLSIQTLFKYKGNTGQELKHLEKKEEAYFKTVCLHCDKHWSERRACAALRRCSETKCPLYLVLLFFSSFSFCATYFSPRRVYHRVPKFCMGF